MPMASHSQPQGLRKQAALCPALQVRKQDSRVKWLGLSLQQHLWRYLWSLCPPHTTAPPLTHFPLGRWSAQSARWITGENALQSIRNRTDV